MPIRMVGVWLGLMAAGAVAGDAADVAWKLPSLDGEFSGDLLPLVWPGVPAMHWKLVTRAREPGERTAALSLDAPGLRAHLVVQVNSPQDLVWQLDSGEVDLAQWFGPFAARYGAKFSGMALSGQMQATGAGRWSDGRLAGHAAAKVSEGRIEVPKSKLVLEGIAVDVVVDDLAGLRTPPAQVVSWTSGRYDAIELGPGRLEFTVTGNQIHVSTATMAVFGGTLALDPFDFSTDREAVEVQARAFGVQLSALLALLPPVLTDGRGRLDGRLAMRLDERGIQVGPGHLGLAAGEMAEMRLAPIPGLLSGNLPPMVRKYYTGIDDLEMGKIPLRVEVLEVDFGLEPDAEGRTAVVHLVGGPSDPKLKAPLDLAINVRGALDALLHLKLDSRLHFGAAR